MLSDMGCHSIAVGWYLLTPAGRAPRHPRAADGLGATSGLLKWGQPRWRDELLERPRRRLRATPAEDFATGLVTYRNPETDQRTQGAVHGLVDVRQAGPAAARRRHRAGLRARSEQLALAARSVHRRRRGRASVADAELALEKATATRGLLAIQPNEPDLYGYTDENVDALAAFRDGRSALLDFDYGLEIVRLTMAAYLSAERGRVVDLTDAATLSRARRLRPADPTGPRRRDALNTGTGVATFPWYCVDAAYEMNAAPRALGAGLESANPRNDGAAVPRDRRRAGAPRSQPFLGTALMPHTR